MTILESLHKGLIVSCQAPVTSPLHDPMIIAAMAKTAMINGAVGVRIDTPNHIEAVRGSLPTTPIIGLWKQHILDSKVYITPNASHAKRIAQSGADIIAIDATSRPRPHGEKLFDLINYIHQELGKLVMADIDTLESGLAAGEMGADLIGSTLYGYTETTAHLTPPGFDLLMELVKYCDRPIVCEGGISSPEAAKFALSLGAYTVVVGGDITGIDLKVKGYCQVLKSNG